MNKKTVVIVDYGMGNLFSLQRVVRHLGAEALISDRHQDIVSAERIILPGVGAFGDGMNNLKQKGLIETLREVVRLSKPLLGICLGMQLFMSEGEEFGKHQGLNFVRGKVVRFSNPNSGGQSYKIPHVGWNQLFVPKAYGNSIQANPFWQGTFFEGIQKGDFVYFVHSYKVVPEDHQVILAETEYGQQRFCSALRLKNILGCQFHPEVSADTGLNILRTFLLLS